MVCRETARRKEKTPSTLPQREAARRHAFVKVRPEARPPSPEVLPPPPIDVHALLEQLFQAYSHVNRRAAKQQHYRDLFYRSVGRAPTSSGEG